MAAADRFQRGAGVRGIGFPISKGASGYWPRRNAAALRQTSIMMIMGTQPGERLMLPTFGSRIGELLFEPNDDVLLGEVVEETKGALQRWDPYIRILAVAPEIVGDSLKIFIDYVDLRDLNEETRRLVFALRRT